MKSDVSMSLQNKGQKSSIFSFSDAKYSEYLVLSEGNMGKKGKPKQLTSVSKFNFSVSVNCS